MNSPLELYNHASTKPALLPESYHPLIFVSIGVWGWAITLAVLYWQRIDVNLLIQTNQNNANQLRPLLLLAVILSWLIFSHILVLEDVIFVYFSDVLVADILISFSGVFTGIFVRLMQQTGFAYSRLVPIVTSVPYFIRFKQCCNDYFKKTSERHRNKRQLINAIKYASAIPVIFLAHHTKVPPDHFGYIRTSSDILWHFWLFLALLTSAFAFVWDLVIDWGLFQVKFWSFEFRKDIHFSDPLWYIMAVAINMSLRLLKIVSHMYQIHPFCVDLAEILRRWIWVIFRFEHEWIKRSSNVEDKL
ncbi:EXS family-domain-containing protein [Gilbertella persicaria]|uniref:Protein-ER retention protein n=1 Tax=Rhizopus stolonifer TaxID=4846 RepID=A0A367KQP8_RHIST|nr:EXS family-domain-containing protein [Gilbertella persicaria]KAI8095076.1 EXS family-domain-containing protein [Gilbertella persicaria]RCI04477.1 protein-ER retention protein [Rhizopus stolonifer]